MSDRDALAAEIEALCDEMGSGFPYVRVADLRAALAARPSPERGCDYCGSTGCDADCDEAFAFANPESTCDCCEGPGPLITSAGGEASVCSTCALALVVAERDAARAELAALRGRIEALIDPVAGMAQPLYGSRYFDEPDIRRALADPAQPTITGDE